MSKKTLLCVGLVVFGLLTAACQSQPVEVVVTRVVEVPGEEVVKEVEKVVTVEVEKVVEVEKIVEVESEGGIQEVTLVARCKGGEFEAGRCNNLVAAAGLANQVLAEQGDNRRIVVKSIHDNADWGDYKTEFELASDAGEAPDIICSGHEHIGDWATAGYLLDVTDDISNYPEFEDVVDSLWASTELNGRRWGVPQDAEARPLYWSKPLLRQLGWSEEEIESLPARIESGEFTWQDMFDTAEAAVQAGVVEPGNGWWHRPQNGPDFLYYYLAAGGTITEEGSDALIFEKEPHLKVFNLLYEATQVRNIMRPDVLSGDYPAWRERTAPFDKIMFVFGGTWRWADWYTNFLQEVGGEDYLFENVGFGLIPANEEGTGKPITLTHPLVYMISSQSEHPDLALLLISKATVKELNTSYAIESGHLGILKSQSNYTPYTTAPFLTQTLYMLDYTTFLPNSPYWSGYSEAWFNGIKAVESGDLTPEEAIDFVVEQMEASLGDGVIIR